MVEGLLLSEVNRPLLPLLFFITIATRGCLRIGLLDTWPLYTLNFCIQLKGLLLELLHLQRHMRVPEELGCFSYSCAVKAAVGMGMGWYRIPGMSGMYPIGR